MEIAESCGNLIVNERPRHLGVAGTKTSSTDVVTVMDKRSEQLARSLLAERRPLDGFLGEEGSHTTSSSGITWVVDPIDATVNYLYGIPAYAVSVAAVVGDGRHEGTWYPIAGAVYDPVAEEMFAAHLGGGARRTVRGTTEPITFSAHETLDRSLVGTGFGYDVPTRAWQGRVLADLIPRIRDMRRFGSAALDLCRASTGQLDAYFERNLNPWDYAAGWVIAEEAGAVVQGFQTWYPTKCMTIVGRPEIVAALEEFLAPFMPSAPDLRR